jgi:hypothetical protein
MDCLVLRPFDGGGKKWNSGDTVPGAIGDGWRNRRQLIDTRYLKPIAGGAESAADATQPPRGAHKSRKRAAKNSGAGVTDGS